MKSLKQIREASGGKEAYQKFFNSILKKFGVSSPSELEGKKKKAFFDAIDKGWDGDNEPKEKGESVKEASKLKGGRGKAEIDINWDGDRKDAKFAATKYKIKLKPTSNGAILSGDKQKILAYLQGQDYDMDAEDIEDLYPELMETYDDPDDLDPDTTHNPDETELATGKKLGEAIYPVMNAAQKEKIQAIAKKNSGNMQKAIKLIDKIRKGLSDNPDVMDILKKANEEVYEVGTDKYAKHAKKCVPGQESVDEANRFSKKLNAPSKAIYDLVLKDIRRNRTTDEKEVNAVVDDIAGVSLTDKEVALVKKAIQHESVNEAIKAGRGKLNPKDALDVDFMGDKKDAKFASTKWKINIKLHRMGAFISGDKQKILAYLRSDDYGMDDVDIEDLFPELMESVDCDARLMGFKASVRRKEGEKQHGRVIVDRRTKGAKAAALRSEKAKAKREEKRKQKEFAEKYPKLDYQYGNDADLAEVLSGANKKLFGEDAVANSVASGNVNMNPHGGKKRKDKVIVKRSDY